MAINLDHFRNKLAGDAERLEVNSKGTDLHRKGVSSAGRAVEWIRDAVGLRTGENRAAMRAFVGALRAEYHPSIASEMEGRLAQMVGDGKPLSARVVRQIIADADTIRALRQHTIEAKNTKLANSFSHNGPQDRLSGYMSSAATVGHALGADDDTIGLLFDSAAPRVVQLRQKIADGIRDLAGKPPQAVSHDAAKALAEKAIKAFLLDAMNTRTLEAVIGARDPDSPVQQKVAGLAGEVGIIGLAGLLADPDSAIHERLVQQAKISAPSDRPMTRTDAEATVSALVSKLMGSEIVAQGLEGAVTGLPDDPVAAKYMADAMLYAAGRGQPGQLDEVVSLVDREVDRLASQGQEGRVAASGLRSLLRESYYRELSDPAVKLAVLGHERDRYLASAQADGDDNDRFEAVMLQNDIIALRLKELDAPTTALRGADLDSLAQRSPELAREMAKLDRMERDCVSSLGGDPDAASLGWKENRDQLARLRQEAGGLEGSGAELQAYISAKMRGLTADMMAKAVAVLGPPPAPMAVVSLGSASRGEASPYSDIEFGILLDRPADQAMQDYTAKLSQLVRLQVANLGENLGKETPLGLHWDGGGNTPLESPTTFIGTADELIRKNLGESSGFGSTVPASIFAFTMFSNCELLYGPAGDGSEWSLVQDMQQKAAAHFEKASVSEQGQSRGQTLGRWAMREGASLAGLRDAVGSDRVDIKSLSRMPMMLAQGLALASGLRPDDGIAPNSTNMRLAWLAEKGVISRQDADTLRDAFSKLGEARIQAHLHNGKADDTVFLDAGLANGGFAAPELRQVIETLLPFVDRIEDYVAGRSATF